MIPNATNDQARDMRLLEARQLAEASVLEAIAYQLLRRPTGYGSIALIPLAGW